MNKPSAKRATTFGVKAAVFLLGAVSLSVPPRAASAQANQASIQPLLDKAHALEVRGRLEMAAQTWQQVLLADPNNTEALGGLARAAKATGELKVSAAYVDRLRAINPNDPNIARVEAMGTQRDNNAQLQQAGKLAQQGQYGQAMNAYRQVFGDSPPAGDSALAYYETEAATEEGRPHAIAGLRTLTEKNPGDSRYQIALGRILTYNPKTRAEGRHLLEAHPGDPQAAEALRQSLLWDAQNPATAASIRNYLAHHNDAQLNQALRSMPRTGGGARAVPLTAEQRAANAVNATRTAEDQAAYRALNSKHLEEAEQRFKAILAKTPGNPNANAGMGYVRMQQANFAGAISYLVQAKQDGSKDPGLDAALQTSRFWNTMGEGAISLNENDLPGAEKNYRAALAMRSTSPEALEGLGGTLLKAQQSEAAIPYFLQFIKVKPAAAHAWRGLFLAQTGAGDTAHALETEHNFPPAVRAELSRDPLFLRSLASAYASAGRDGDAQRVLKAALDLPFPTDAKGVEADTQLQYAGVLQAANHLDQAAGLYRQVLAKDPNNTSAWQGLVRAEHALDQDQQALQTIESMPPASYAQAMREPGFESTVASIYQGQKRLDVAEDILGKAIAQQTTAGQKPSVPVQIQLAGIYLQRNNPQQAYPLYAQVISEHPERPDAWKGLLSSLHDTGRDSEALAEVGQIPAATRAQLENDVDYLQTIGSVYNALNQPQQAQVFLRRVQQHYAAQHAMPPADVDIQNAWLLYNGLNDAGLYRQLMAIGDRNDLTDPQRRTVQTIWSNWAVRRANQAASAGNNNRALAILNATARAFPDNPGVIKALAAGYGKAGMAKQAVAIWKAQDMSSAPASDYKAAVGAALAAGDTKDAETWLRFGLDQYPKDAELLILGAKFEQARGDTNRAADYYRASLDAMPAVDPGIELATELSRPAAAAGRLPSASQSQDLAGLLQPGANEPSTQPTPSAPVSTSPYLPGYGNSGSGAPVRLNGLSGYGEQPNSLDPTPSAPVVPSYMKPAPHTAMPRSGPKPRLRDYVPQAAIDEPVPMDGTEVPLFHNASYVTPGPGDGPILTLAEYRQQRVSRAPELLRSVHMAAAEAPPQMVPPQSVNQTANQAPAKPAPASGPTPPQTTKAPPAEEVYGPYVPYQPPAPVSVKLGNSSVGSAAPSRPEITDVMPTARTVPNARSRSGASSHPDIAAANAAATRRRQSNPVPAEADRTGQSNPPAEDYTTAPTQPAQFTGQPYNPAQASQGQTQVAQPNSPSHGSTPTSTTQQYQQPQSAQQPQSTQSYPPVQQGGETLGQQYPQPNTRVSAAPGPYRSRRRAPRRAKATPEQPSIEPTPAPQPTYSGLSYPGVGQPLTYQPYPTIGPAYPLGPAPTDSDLIAKRVPPLRGIYYTGEMPSPQVPLTARQQAELDLATLEASYSGWLGGTGSARYRSGTPGADRLTDLEATFEASATVGNSVRFTVVPRAVFLNSGLIDTTTATTNDPVIGTLPGNAINPPQQQFASGVGGEFQVVTNNFAGAIGYTPYEFLVRNVTGRLLFKPNRHFTLFGDRSAVTETQLSYAGLRDPGSATPVFSGNIWGGVISTGGGARFDMGDARAGFYITADGADLSGYHVLQNYKFEGSMGAYFLAHTFPGYGSLNVGGSMFGMHYNHNERGQTYGLGGYFSPGAYFLASVPVTFTGRYGSDFHYTVAGSLGVQTFQEDNQIFYPLDRGLQNGLVCTNGQLTTHSCGQSPVNSNTGGNYSINTEGAYRIAEHWFAGGFLSANNTNNYNTVTGGFFIRYLFRPQFGTEDYPTGLFPVEGFRPLRVP